MNPRHATLAATLAGLTLLAAGCGGGGGSSEASTTPADAAALLATDVAATPGGLTALGVTAPDLADARLHAYGTFGTPANVFKPRVAASAATTAVPSTVVPATTVPTAVTTPVAGTTTPTTGAPLVP